MNIFEEAYNFQENHLKPKNYIPLFRKEFFSIYTAQFKLIPLAKGVHPGPQVPKPTTPKNDTNTDWIAYNEYKQEYNKYKKPIGKWDIDYNINNKYDKYGILTGDVNTSESIQKNGYKQPLLIVDIDDLSVLMHYNSIMEIQSWKPTYTVKTGYGFQLYYSLAHKSGNFTCARIEEIGTDLRANGGYGICAGSVHPGTHTYYEIMKGKYDHVLPEAEFDMNTPPEIVLDLCNKETRNETLSRILNGPSSFFVNKGFSMSEDMKSQDTISENGKKELPTNPFIQTTASSNIQTQNSKIISFDNLSETDAELYIANKIKTLDTEYQQLIYNGNPSDRSNASFFMKVYLISNGWKYDEIKFVFEKYKIGEKDKEKENYNYFEWTYQKAVEYYHKYGSNKSLYDSRLNPVNDYGSLTVLELMNTKIDYPMIIEPFLMKQSKLLLCAEKGSCKTHFSLQMIIDLINTNKSKFLDTFEIKPENRPDSILYINGENSIYELQMKFESIGKNLSESEYKSVFSKFHIMTKKDFCTFNDRFDNEYFIDGIINRIIETESKILVIDNLQCFNKGEENDNSNMRILLDNLTPITTKFDIPIILVHHSGKQASPDNFARGAASIGDWCSHALFIEKLKDCFKIHNPKSRTSAPFTPIELSFNGEVFTPVSSNQAKSSNISDSQVIIDVMKAHNNKYDKKGDLKSAVKNHLAGIGISKCSSRIDAMITNAVSTGIIKEIVSGINNQKSYILA